MTERSKRMKSTRVVRGEFLALALASVLSCVLAPLKNVNMIRGLKANYSREFYEVDGEYICIKGTKIAVDTIKI